MNKRLGRGLGALLGQGFGGDDGDVPSTDVQTVPVRQIDPNPYQPREAFDPEEMAGLVRSIQQHGVLQPVVVRSVGGRYQLVAGERRLRAAMEAGLEEMPARVLALDDQRVFEIALVENLQRQDLNAIEKAKAFQEYLRKFSISHEELAATLGLNRSTISNLIRLLELPERVMGAVRAGALSAGHARALLPLGEEAEQIAMAQRIAAEGLSVRQVEAIVGQRLQQDADGPSTSDATPLNEATPRGPSTKHPHLHSLEDELRTALGTKIDIRSSAKGRGRIVIHFSSHEEFERLRRELCASSPGAVAAVG